MEKKSMNSMIEHAQSKSLVELRKKTTPDFKISESKYEKLATLITDSTGQIMYSSMLKDLVENVISHEEYKKDMANVSEAVSSAVKVRRNFGSHSETEVNNAAMRELCENTRVSTNDLNFPNPLVNDLLYAEGDLAFAENSAVTVGEIYDNLKSVTKDSVLRSRYDKHLKYFKENSDNDQSYMNPHQTAQYSQVSDNGFIKSHFDVTAAAMIRNSKDPKEIRRNLQEFKESYEATYSNNEVVINHIKNSVPAKLLENATNVVTPNYGQLMAGLTGWAYSTRFVPVVRFNTMDSNFMKLSWTPLDSMGTTYYYPNIGAEAHINMRFNRFNNSDVSVNFEQATLVPVFIGLSRPINVESPWYEGLMKRTGLFPMLQQLEQLALTDGIVRATDYVNTWGVDGLTFGILSDPGLRIVEIDLNSIAASFPGESSTQLLMRATSQARYAAANENGKMVEISNVFCDNNYMLAIENLPLNTQFLPDPLNRYFIMNRDGIVPNTALTQYLPSLTGLVGAGKTISYALYFNSTKGYRDTIDGTPFVSSFIDQVLAPTLFDNISNFTTFGQDRKQTMISGTCGKVTIYPRTCTLVIMTGSLPGLTA